MMRSLVKTRMSLFLPCFLGIASISIAFARSYHRIQTTLVGYELGELKMQEEHLLERRAQLQMELAKLTTKEHLMLLSKGNSKTFTIESLAEHR